MPTNALTFKADIMRRLHCVEGHVRGIAAMAEAGVDCESLVRQTLAVRAALDEVNRLILQRHLDTCLREYLCDPEAAARRQCLSELGSLYQLFGVPAPFKMKEHV